MSAAAAILTHYPGTHDTVNGAQMNGIHGDNTVLYGTQADNIAAYQYAVPTNDNQQFQTGGSYEQSRRQVSSVIISEELLGEVPPEHTVTYVEVPVVEEVVRTVPVKSIVEVDKVVPRYEVEYVERIVEVPQVQYIDREVEKEEVHEVVREVPGPRQIQEIPREVIRTVPKIEYVNVEKVVEVPGEIIEVPRIEVSRSIQEIKRHHDKQVPVVVAQTIRPVITESAEVVEVDVYEYEPEVIPVDVHVATPIASRLTAMGAVQEAHQPVSIPAAQYNTILRSLNGHLDDNFAQLPYIAEDGQINVLMPQETPGFVPLEELDQNGVPVGSQSQITPPQQPTPHYVPILDGRQASVSQVPQQAARSTASSQYGRGPSYPHSLNENQGQIPGRIASQPQQIVYCQPQTVEPSAYSQQPTYTTSQPRLASQGVQPAMYDPSYQNVQPETTPSEQYTKGATATPYSAAQQPAYYSHPQYPQSQPYQNAPSYHGPRERGPNSVISNQAPYYPTESIAQRNGEITDRHTSVKSGKKGSTSPGTNRSSKKSSRSKKSSSDEKKKKLCQC